MASMWSSSRFCVAYAIFVVTLADHCKRYAISLTLVAMTTYHNHSSANSSSNLMKNGSNDDAVATYNWTREQKSNIIASYFYGYTVSLLVCGVLIKSVGARRGIMFSTTLSGTIQFLFPWFATFGPVYFSLLRLFDGLITFQGFLFVGTCKLLGTWSLPHERGKLSTITQAGTWGGIILGFTFTGFISESNLGWPWSFYASGIIMLLSVIIWAIFGYDYPESHPRISASEMSCIRQYLKDENDSKHEEKKDENKVPWMTFIRTKPVSALVIFHTLYNWAYYYSLAMFPQYFNDVHNVDIAQNGLLNCLPYIFGMVGTLITGHVIDFIITAKIMTVTKTKKLILALYSISLSLCFLLMAIWGDNFAIALTALCVSGAVLGIGLITFISNFADISPSYAGEISSFTNCIGCLPGFLAPIINGQITKEKSTQDEWMISFLLSAALTLLGGMCYVALGSGNIQTWDTKYYKKSHLLLTENECSKM